MKCKVERATIETAIEAYSISFGHFPETLDDIYPEWVKRIDFDWAYTSTEDGFTLTGFC